VGGRFDGLQRRLGRHGFRLEQGQDILDVLAL
jgi:hypothetical protein